ncbi:response regulator [candidate division KSB1 bacterium]|nr:response regulator [candidate division KSB1 bacterium]
MKAKILIVDDEPSIRRLIEYNLGKKFTIHAVKDGQEALNWLNEGNMPDLVITDILMPNIDGYEFVQNIRASGFYQDIPVIFLSAKASSMDRIKGLKMGADDYLVKPFNPEELEIRIENILQRSQK